jgi:serine protease Do
VEGAIVSSVPDGSAAARAGVVRGDVITAFNGKPIDSVNTLRNTVAEAGPATKSTVTVMRDGHERTLDVTLGEASAPQAARNAGGPDTGTALGVSVQPLTPQLASQAGVDQDLKGLLVGDVDPSGRAADAGVQQGDVLLEVNRQAVPTVDALREALAKNADRPVLLLVSRGGQNLYLTARPGRG